jgi:hypothetical protein
MTYRHRPKCHGHVGTWPTAEIVAADPGLAKFDAMLTADGFNRSEKTPVYRRRDGTYTLRVVWRRRADGSSEVWTKSLRVQFVEMQEAPA